MANLTIVASEVRVVRSDAEHQQTSPVAEDVEGGQYVRQDTTTGYWALGNATTAGELGNVWGIAVGSRDANDALTAYMSGSELDLGDALDGMSPGDPVYVSDTDGTLADTAGTVSRIVGHVVMGYGSTSGDKLLRLA